MDWTKGKKCVEVPFFWGMRGGGRVIYGEIEVVSGFEVVIQRPFILWLITSLSLVRCNFVAPAS